MRWWLCHDDAGHGNGDGNIDGDGDGNVDGDGERDGDTHGMNSQPMRWL